jgi:hypothetical protein
MSIYDVSHNETLDLRHHFFSVSKNALKLTYGKAELKHFSGVIPPDPDIEGMGGHFWTPSLQNSAMPLIAWSVVPIGIHMQNPVNYYSGEIRRLATLCLPVPFGILMRNQWSYNCMVSCADRHRYTEPIECPSKPLPTARVRGITPGKKFKFCFAVGEF